MEDFSEQSIVQIVETFYQAKIDKELFRQYDAYLKRFTKDERAWDICLKILLQTSLSERVLFFAANVLKQKMRFDYASSFPNDSIHIQFRDQLMIITKSFASSKNNVLISTLCLCLAIHSLHTHMYWESVIEYLAHSFSTDIDQVSAALLVLRYMAEEVDNEDTVVDYSVRDHFYHILKTNQEKLMEFLNVWSDNVINGTVNQSSGFNIVKFIESILTCFYSWLRFGLSDTVLLNLPFQYAPLVKLIFREVDTENFEHASSCICELLHISTSKDKYKTLKDLVLQKIKELLPRYYKRIKEDDTEDLAILMDIYVELGTTHMKEIIESNDLEILQILLLFFNSDHLKYRVLVDFFKLFCRRLTKIEDPALKIEKIKTFAPIIEHLLAVSVKKIQLEEDDFKALSVKNQDDEHFDEIFKARSRFSKLIKYICICVEPNHVAQKITMELASAYSTTTSNPNDVQAWIKIEALLETTISIIKSINSPNELELVAAPVNLIFELPADAVQLRLVSNRIILEMTRLLKNNELSKKLVGYIVGGIANPLTLDTSADCFYELVYYNKQVLSTSSGEFVDRNFSSNIQVYLRIISSRLEDGHLKFIEGIVTIICAQQNPALIHEHLQKIISPIGTSLWTTSQSGQVADDQLKILTASLDVLGNVLKSCDGLKRFDAKSHPLIEIFKQLWPVIQNLLSIYQDKEEVVEALCRCIKHSMRSLDVAFGEFLLPFIQFTITAYQKNPISSYLYCAEFCSTVFGQIPEYKKIMQELVDFMMTQTFNFLNDPNMFSQNPDLVEDLFGMAGRYIKHCPSLLFESSNIGNLLQCAIAGIGLEHSEAAKSLYCFIEDFCKSLAPAEDKPPICDPAHIENMKKLFEANGQAIVQKLINAIVKVPTSSVTEYIVDLLRRIGEVCKTTAAQWIYTAVQSVPNDCMTIEEKKTFHKEFYTYNDEAVLRNLTDFAQRCKRSAMRKAIF